jgi:uncharacterized protein (UPF0332 family)
VEGREFLKVAEHLLKGKGEAAWRSAVSRAYYGAFNHVVGFYKSKGVIFDRGEYVHKRIRDCMANCAVEEIVDVSALLGSIHTERIRADYNMLHKGFLKKQNSEATVINAKSCIAAFDKHRDRSVKGVKEHFTKVYRCPSS